MDLHGREVIYISSDDEDATAAPVKTQPQEIKPYQWQYSTTPQPVQSHHQFSTQPKPEPIYNTYQTLNYHSGGMPGTAVRKQPKPEPQLYHTHHHNMAPLTRSQPKPEPQAYHTHPSMTPSSSKKSTQPVPKASQTTPSSSAKKRKAQHDEPSGSPEEKRARRFRPHPPRSFQDVYDRATSQKFFVLDRKRRGTPECPEEKVEMTGSTGNIYTVHIKQVPTCTCPHYQKGNQCKHWMWVMSRVLRADFKHVYQLAFLSEELREIFAKAPPIEGPGAAADKNRKPVEGDCPICYSELEEKGRKDNIVWCQAACGNNIHKHCFETWAKTKRGSDVTCPLCRSVWQGDQDVVKRIQKNRPVNSDGYVNVADQLGISQHRDTSTYSSWWGRY